ncbi:BCCT family transporter [Flammeovirga agarivorans]|uniref:BCCT transporter n=1 Tax=Flammeovirga agarivorans TaxID=2726742 RepID=A0A7X8XX13_9BACT|nr:BCCT family transporter [Flammeovirga agarivorans]NLR92806.1 BCCT transporter [Flammeovirga agarivorans]
MKLSFNQWSIIISILIGCLFILFPEATTNILDHVINAILHSLDRFLLWIVTGILILCLIIGFSPLGNKKLGDQPPEFSTFSWVAMLFAAGMGSGLIFWGVAEPIYHLQSPLNTDHSPMMALSITNFHWGIHAWAVYAFSGLIIAWFSYNRGRGMNISSTFSDSTTRKAFQSFDMLAVMAIIFGVAGTLANSIALIQTGVEHLVPYDITGLPFRLIVLLFISIAFMLSSVSGLQKGVKTLSDFNVILALLILLIIFLMSSPFDTLKLFVEVSISYFKDLPLLSFILPESARKWSQSWTIIYFLWWIAWAPFTGLFIARISKGRTIREFLFSIIGYPTIITIFWFTVFGGNGLFSDQVATLQSVINENYTNGLFVFLEGLPFGTTLSFLCILLLVTFVITSADSAIFVTAALTGNSSKVNKIIWSVLLLGISSALLIKNNVDLNKVIAITGAIPFTFILLFQGIMFFRDIFKK